MSKSEGTVLHGFFALELVAGHVKAATCTDTMRGSECKILHVYMARSGYDVEGDCFCVESVLEVTHLEYKL